MSMTKLRLFAFAAILVSSLVPTAFAADPPVTLLSVGTVATDPPDGENARTEQYLWVADMMVGSVTVVNSDSQLRVRYQAINPGWEITQTDLDLRLALSDIPQVSQLPVVADLAFHNTPPPGTAFVEYVFGIDPNGPTNTNLYVAARAQVQSPVACQGEDEDDPDHHGDHDGDHDGDCADKNHHGRKDNHQGRKGKDGKRGRGLQCDHHEGKGRPCDHHENRASKRDRRDDDRKKPSLRSRHRADSGCDHHEGRGKRCDRRERKGGCDGHEGKNKPCDNHEGDHDDDAGGGSTSCWRVETAWGGDQLFWLGYVPRYFIHVIVMGPQ
jgi:hypothetical protein